MDYSDITTVIPTLNEGRSLKVLIPLLLGRYPGIRVLVVDDGSTDGTKRVVSGFASRGSQVAFLDRKAKGLKKGLTGSMADGLMASRTKYVVFMDGDLQHPVEVLGRIAAELKRGNEIVVATRHKFMNRILYRRVISDVSTALGLAVLGAQGSKTSRDIFSGYFGLRRDFAAGKLKENRQRFVGEGYKFLFDLLKSTKRGEASLAEVSYLFKTRKYGSSKASLKQGIALAKSFLS